MNSKELVEWHHKVEEYIQKHKLTDFFENLTRILVLSRPAHPLTFLADFLDNRRVQRLILVTGPVATSRNEIANSMANLFNYRVISAEEFFPGDIGWVDDNLLSETIVEQIKKTERHFRGIVISGFPNNLRQAVFLQTRGIIAERVFYLESDIEFVKQHYEQYPNVDAALLRDQLNRKELFSLYGDYLDVFNTTKRTREDINENIKQIIKLRDRKYPQLRFPRVCVIRPPWLKERAQQLTNIFAKRYGLKSIITFHVIEEAIRDNHALGPLLNEAMLKGTPLPPDVINSLVYTQIIGTQARTKGYVLEGFPRNAAQLKFINGQNINLFVILNEDEDVLFNKSKSLKLDPLTNIKYEKVPLNDKPLLDRLINYSVPSDSQLKQQVSDYQSFIKDIEIQYGERVQVFKMDKDSTETILRITDVFLNNPKIYN